MYCLAVSLDDHVCDGLPVSPLSSFTTLQDHRRGCVPYASQLLRRNVGKSRMWRVTYNIVVSKPHLLSFTIVRKNADKLFVIQRHSVTTNPMIPLADSHDIPLPAQDARFRGPSNLIRLSIAYHNTRPLHRALEVAQDIFEPAFHA
jgi:hypothetical protein